MSLTPDGHASEPPVRPAPAQRHGSRDHVAAWIRFGVVTGLLAIFSGIALWQSHLFLYTDPSGDVLQVDRLTGAITFAPRPTLVRQVHVWSKYTLPNSGGNFAVSLSTKWRDGKVLILLRFDPIAEKPSKPFADARDIMGGSYAIILRDRDTFPLAKINIPVRELVLEEGTQSYGYYGGTSLSISSYDAIASWDVEWALPQK